MPLAFGLTVVTMTDAIGHISGCRLNPAVSVGLWAGGCLAAARSAPYMIAQVLVGLALAGGALIGAAIERFLGGREDRSTDRHRPVAAE